MCKLYGWPQTFVGRTRQRGNEEVSIDCLTNLVRGTK
jgi:hypothetical protein